MFRNGIENNRQRVLGKRTEGLKRAACVGGTFLLQ